MKEEKPRSFFWPAILIVVGVVWLLGNLNIGLPPFDFFLLLQLWPLLLVVAGINLLIGRRFPLLRAAIVIIAVVGALAYVYLAPSLGLAPTSEIKHAEFAEPLDQAEAATIVIGSSVGRVNLTALTDSS